MKKTLTSLALAGVLALGACASPDYPEAYSGQIEGPNGVSVRPKTYSGQIEGLNGLNVRPKTYSRQIEGLNGLNVRPENYPYEEGRKIKGGKAGY
ncbi:hypothetical protein COU59_02890 [Candidatus Pacearchaeota archaeon CG10_big_fil_rev_8_21_14_0_10_34_12]|nr:MAG: hypothetical protein COU59_02890 [Candidatus Pacearchaeota archaeon CG10_big_fil_rev_8_21_14_0_10_34_12]